MKETRIYGRNVEIKPENTKSFYDSRAKAMGDMADTLSAKHRIPRIRIPESHTSSQDVGSSP